MPEGLQRLLDVLLIECGLCGHARKVKLVDKFPMPDTVESFGSIEKNCACELFPFN